MTAEWVEALDHLSSIPETYMTAGTDPCDLSSDLPRTHCGSCAQVLAHVYTQISKYISFIFLLNLRTIEEMKT